MKKIVWLTADYFIDVDMEIVPMLRNIFDIHWIIIRGKNSPREIPESLGDYEEYRLNWHGMLPFVVIDYIQLIKHIKNLSPELLYVNFLGGPYFFPLLVQIFNKKRLCFMAHNVAPRATWNRMLSLYYPYIFRHIKYVHIPSTHNIPYIKDHYPHLTYFYIPMLPKSFGKASDKISWHDKTIFLFFGHVVSNKRLDHLLEAYKMLPAEDKENAVIEVYGKCKNVEMFETLAKGEKNIKLHFGYAPNEIIPNVFTNSSYLVLPYDNVDQSGPSMIAMHYNLPIICTDLEAFREIVIDKETGFTYKRNDIKDLCRVMSECIKMEKGAYVQLKANLSKFTMENFSSEAIKEKYNKMLDSIMQ